MSLSSFFNIENNSVYDESIIREFSKLKSNMSNEDIIEESKEILKISYNRNYINFEGEDTDLLKNIIGFYEAKLYVTEKQKKVLCKFISLWAFWNIGPTKMLEIINQQSK